MGIDFLEISTLVEEWILFCKIPLPYREGARPSFSILSGQVLKVQVGGGFSETFVNAVYSLWTDSKKWIKE
jgi:hypothetical protein